MRIYPKGSRVSQPTYGTGTITDADAHHTVIDFDNHGLRKFMTNLVVLETTDEPAPAKAKAVRRTKAKIAAEAALTKN